MLSANLWISDYKVLQAKGADAEALADYGEAVLNATGNVENSFMALAQDQQELVQLRNETAALTKARDSSQRAYADGAIPLTDVLDSQRELLQTQDQLALNQADTAQDSVSVFRALGGGW